MKKIITICVCLSFLSLNHQAPVQSKSMMSIGHQQKQIFASVSQSNMARKYILGPNDVISISVYDSPEFEQKEIRVQPDGNIIVAPFGVINVGGITLDNLYEMLVEKYKFYLKSPIVSINLVKTKPFVVYVSGAVLNPGSYELNTDTEQSEQNIGTKPEVRIQRKTPLLSNILVAAGGISYDADLEHVKIHNNIDKTDVEVNLLDLVENGNAKNDFYLIPGDSVMIPRLVSPLAINDAKYKKYVGSTISPKIVPVRVFGYVKNPGLVNLESAQSANLNSAIMAAGGYGSNLEISSAAYAAKKVMVSRIDNNGKLVTRTVNPMNNDIALLPNDVIFVPEKTGPLAGKAFDYLNRVFTPIGTFAGSYNNWALMFNPTRYQVIGK